MDRRKFLTKGAIIGGGILSYLYANRILSAWDSWRYSSLSPDVSNEQDLSNSAKREKPLIDQITRAHVATATFALG